MLRGSMPLSKAEPAPERPTVLLVEDQVLIRLMVADELRQLGIQVLEASSAEEAWLVLQSPLPVHLLFTDVHLPGRMDGIALAGRVRMHYPQLKVIITSSELPQGAAPVLADAFVAKPYIMPILVKQIMTLLEQANAIEG